MRLIWLFPVLAVLHFSFEVLASGEPSFQGKRRPFTVVSPPYPAPVVSWHTKKSGVTHIGRHKGKVVLLNFWASWCAACLYEMPDLDKLANHIGHADFEVVTVNLDDAEPSLIARYFERLGVSRLPHYSDPSDRSVISYEIREGLPWSFLIDRKGFIRGYMMGAAEWLTPEGQSLITHYLDE